MYWPKYKTTEQQPKCSRRNWRFKRHMETVPGGFETAAERRWGLERKRLKSRLDEESSYSLKPVIKPAESSINCQTATKQDVHRFSHQRCRWKSLETSRALNQPSTQFSFCRVMGYQEAKVSPSCLSNIFAHDFQFFVKVTPCLNILCN